MIDFITFCDYTGTFAFAISGIRLASAKQFDWFGAYVVGVVTAVGGGTIRDILINEVPLIFRKDIYALACVFGGIIYYACLQKGIGPSLTQLIAANGIFVSRIEALKYNIIVPVIKGEE